MDSAIAKSANGIRLSLAIAHRAIQMLKPDLHQVAVLGFYLLTDELEARRVGGTRLKMRLYGNQANTIHKAFKGKLAHMAEFEVQGGAAWVLTEKPYSAYEHFNVLENELAKQLRITLC